MGGLSDFVLDYLMDVELVKRNTEAFVSSDTLWVVVVLVCRENRSSDKCSADMSGFYSN